MVLLVVVLDCHCCCCLHYYARCWQRRRYRFSPPRYRVNDASLEHFRTFFELFLHQLVGENEKPACGMSFKDDGKYPRNKSFQVDVRMVFTMSWSPSVIFRLEVTELVNVGRRFLIIERIRSRGG